MLCRRVRRFIFCIEIIMYMDDLIANPWIVGIGGGVISSLIVFFITKFFLSKKENKEYEQKVRLATNEVVYAVRP